MIFFFPGLRRAENLQNELRALFYLYMEVCNSLNSPNRGVVFVLYDVDNFRGNLGGLGVNELSRLFFSMPMHIAGLHVCLGKQQLPATVVAKGVMMFSSSRIKAKRGCIVEATSSASTCWAPLAFLGIRCSNFAKTKNSFGTTNWRGTIIVSKRRPHPSSCQLPILSRRRTTTFCTSGERSRVLETIACWH